MAQRRDLNAGDLIKPGARPRFGAAWGRPV